MKMIEVALAPRQLLASMPSPTALPGHISVGVPVVTPIDPRKLDNGILSDYVNNEARRSTFYLVHLVVSIHPVENEWVTKLGVGVVLTKDASPANHQGPIAWSLYPLASSEPVNLSSSISVAAKLGVLETQASRKVDSTRQRTFVHAFGERESSFEWRFERTSSYDLVGVHSMFAVVKGPLGWPLRGEIVISADVERRRFGILTARAVLPDDVRTLQSDITLNHMDSSPRPRLDG